MDYQKKYKLSSDLLKKAVELGASLAGFADLEALKKEPSRFVVPHIPAGTYGSQESPYGLAPGEVLWPDGGKTVMVVAVEHPESKPELDWWYGLIDPPGNRILKKIVGELKKWLADNYTEVKVWSITYHIEKGGLFLKEAARLAGLGCIGRNNILITPEYGPRVRLRALVLDVALPFTGPTAFDPCPECEAPCLKCCPNKAFDEIVLTPEQTGQKYLPGRIGNYYRNNCAQIMQKNEDEAKPELVQEISSEPIGIIKYCRNCELSCPVGRIGKQERTT